MERVLLSLRVIVLAVQLGLATSVVKRDIGQMLVRMRRVQDLRRQASQQRSEEVEVEVEVAA
jgi:hypothetical protein